MPLSSLPPGIFLIYLHSLLPPSSFAVVVSSSLSPQTARRCDRVAHLALCARHKFSFPSPSFCRNSASSSAIALLSTSPRVSRTHDDDDNVGGEANVKARAEKKEHRPRARKESHDVCRVPLLEFQTVPNLEKWVYACGCVVHRRARSRCVRASIGAHTCGGHLALEI